MGARENTGIGELVIRRPGIADRDRLASLDSYAADHPARVVEIDRWLASAEVLIAETSGRVIAYAAVDRSFLGQPYLAIVMVDADFRRRGAGRLLVEACRAAHPRLWTSTNQSNLAMQGLLNRLGFRPAGRIEGLDDGDPELFYLSDHSA